ncbi:enoyl-CoA hydratase/isomerase family protein [Stutzerimonas tarimensis]|uniref:3-hydroxyisobutyryl-CoA hydrolase n=1 Tax=Stutzerimonas tarimensis TaxID=1507735 RepID=A0ABV7TBK9_9GAMM
MSEAQAPIQAEVRNRVGQLTLNRPAGLNALNVEMVRLLREHLEAWEKDAEVLAVVLRASGEKAFCAGGDIRALYDSHFAGDGAYMAFFEEEYALDQYLYAYPKPVLALINGLVLGGGMGLVQGASLRVITDRSRMGMPETGIGYFPDTGGSYFLSHLPGELGTYLGITGQQVRAADALYTGLADWCLPSDTLEEFDRCLDGMSWNTHPREALRTLVSALASNKLAGSELKALRPAIDGHFAHDDIAAIFDSLAGERRPEFQDWAEETLNVMRTRSPLAMAVTLESLRRGRDMMLSDCFAMELHLDSQWFDKGDFIEGVRALIIDKDKTPRWNPPGIEGLDRQQVLAFYSDLEPAIGKIRTA